MSRLVFLHFFRLFLSVFLSFLLEVFPYHVYSFSLIPPSYASSPSPAQNSEVEIEEPALVDTDCVPVNNPSASWKSKFPFDLVYPIGDNDTPIENDCISVDLWGFQKDMCTPMTLVHVVKNAFLIRLAIESLINL